MKKDVCNMDCFNCIHPDCIKDGVTYRQPRELEQAAMTRKEYRQDYYRRNRERIIAAAKKYRAEHYDEILARQREYQRAYRAAHHDELLAKQRERQRRYYAEKKAKNTEAAKQ